MRQPSPFPPPIAPRTELSEAFSLYLDLVRLLAAVAVMLTHLWPVFVPGLRLPWPGHEAVIVFFVLSGYVIGHVAERRDGTLGAYAANRLSRLWSVALPALALALLVVALAGPALPDTAPPALRGLWNLPPEADWPALLRRTLGNALFLGQIWWTDTQAPLNNPFWSINMEAWYYAIFGAAWFLRGPSRIAAPALLAAASGPKILLLMPCWLLGVCLWRCGWRMSRQTAALLFAASALALLALFVATPQRLVAPLLEAATGPLPRLTLAYAGDYLTAMLVAINFLAAANLRPRAQPRPRLTRAIRTGAGFTLSVYLYHVPLAALVVTVYGLHGPAGLAAVVALILALGRVTEWQRGRLRAVLRSCTIAWPRRPAVAPSFPLAYPAGPSVSGRSAWTRSNPWRPPPR